MNRKNEIESGAEKEAGQNAPVAQAAGRFMETDTMKAALRIIRRMAIEGKHMANCMADEKARADGMRQVWQARRIARRLGYSLRTAGVEL